MKIEIIGHGPITCAQLDEILFGTSTINRKSPIEETMDKLINEARRGEVKTIIFDSLGDIAEEIEEDVVGKYNGKSICFDIQSITANHKKNAFTVVWADGSHTIVHLQPGDVWDDEKALAMCFTKKALGNKGNFNDKFNDALEIMKTIPAESAPEKACNCDGKRDSGIHSCTECKCKEEPEVGKALAKEFVKKSIEKVNSLTEAMDKLKESADNVLGKAAKAAEKSSKSLKEMIDALTGETVGVDVKPVNIYKVFIRISGKSHYDSEHLTIESLRARVHEIAEELYGKKPYYYRTWMGDNGRMIIDFGHYTQFIEVEGITPDEYVKH